MAIEQKKANKRWMHCIENDWEMRNGKFEKGNRKTVKRINKQVQSQKNEKRVSEINKMKKDELDLGCLQF